MPRRLLVLILMAFTIASSVGASMSAATGRATQNHLVYARNAQLYFLSYLTSTQALSWLYSSNSGASWTAPTGSPFTLAAAHNSEGRNYGFAYANLASTDVLHLCANYSSASSGLTYSSRFTLGTTVTNTNAEARTDGSHSLATNTLAIQSGGAVVLNSAGKPVVGSSYLSSGNGDAAVATNNDAGTSWTAGYGVSTTNAIGTGSQWAQSFALLSLGSGKVLGIADNEAATGPGGFTQLNYAVYNAGWGTSGTALAGVVTNADDNQWGAVAVSTTQIDLVALSNNVSAFVHRQFNGTSWAAKTAPGTLALAKTAPAISGIALVSDGTDLWAGAIDTSKNIKYAKYTSGSDTWGAWTTLEATRTNQPGYITGVYNPDKTEIMWAWTELNGANYDLIGSVLSLGGGAVAAQPWTWVPSLGPVLAQ